MGRGVSHFNNNNKNNNSNNNCNNNNNNSNKNSNDNNNNNNNNINNNTTNNTTNNNNSIYKAPDSAPIYRSLMQYIGTNMNITLTAAANCGDVVAQLVQHASASSSSGFHDQRFESRPEHRTYL